jgi:hypothetical protein
MMPSMVGGFDVKADNSTPEPFALTNAIGIIVAKVNKVNSKNAFFSLNLLYLNQNFGLVIFKLNESCL